MRARNLRKKEAFKKQTETQKAFAAMATTPATVKCESEIETSDPPPAPSTNPDDSSKSDTQKSIRTNNPAAVAKKKVYSVKVENDTENTEAEPTDPAEALRLERLKKQKEKQQEFLKMQQKRKAEEELKVCIQVFHVMSSEVFLRVVMMTWETCWLKVERRCGKRSRKCRRCSISFLVTVDSTEVTNASCYFFLFR